MKNSYRVQDIDAYSFTVHEGEKTESVAHVFLARSSSSNKIRVDDMRFTISSPRFIAHRVAPLMRERAAERRNW